MDNLKYGNFLFIKNRETRLTSNDWVEVEKVVIDRLEKRAKNLTSEIENKEVSDLIFYKPENFTDDNYLIGLEILSLLTLELPKEQIVRHQDDGSVIVTTYSYMQYLQHSLLHPQDWLRSPSSGSMYGVRLLKP